MNPQSRLCIFAHFDRDNFVDDYVFTYLHGLREVATYIVFVTTSTISPEQIEKLKQVCARVIVRENIGYDFYSWKVGLASCTDINYDELILCNDSCYGPLFPFGEAFLKMQNRECDFWGLTGNQQVAYHLQSYFLVFRARAIQSDAFKKFWQDMVILDEKLAIIVSYEVGLTQTLIKSGLRSATYFEWKFNYIVYLIYHIYAAHLHFFVKLVMTTFRPKSGFSQRVIAAGFTPKSYLDIYKVNYTHNFWVPCFLMRVPLIKIELLRDNPLKVSLRKFKSFLDEKSAYDINLIFKHLKRIGVNDQSGLKLSSEDYKS